MTINESRLKNGTLKLGPVGTGQMDLSCQVTNARINSSYADDGDTVTVLCGETKAPPQKLDGRSMAGSLVQDFDYSEANGGVTDYLWNHELEVVAFEFVPDDPLTGPTLTGSVELTVPSESYGGDVGGRLTHDFEWKVSGPITRTYPAGTQTSEAAAA